MDRENKKANNPTRKENSSIFMPSSGAYCLTTKSRTLFNLVGAFLFKDIVAIPYKTLLQQIKEEDYKQKAELIEQIETFHGLYKKNSDVKVKEIIDNLLTELEEVNNKIERLRKIK